MVGGSEEEFLGRGSVEQARDRPREGWGWQRSPCRIPPRPCRPRHPEMGLLTPTQQFGWHRLKKPHGAGWGLPRVRGRPASSSEETSALPESSTRCSWIGLSYEWKRLPVTAGWKNITTARGSQAAAEGRLRPRTSVNLMVCKAARGD